MWMTSSWSAVISWCVTASSSSSSTIFRPFDMAYWSSILEVLASGMVELRAWWARERGPRRARMDDLELKWNSLRGWLPGSLARAAPQNAAAPASSRKNSRRRPPRAARFRGGPGEPRVGAPQPVRGDGRRQLEPERQLAAGRPVLVHGAVGVVVAVRLRDAGVRGGAAAGVLPAARRRAAGREARPRRQRAARHAADGARDAHGAPAARARRQRSCRGRCPPRSASWRTCRCCGSSTTS